MVIGEKPHVDCHRKLKSHSQKKNRPPIYPHVPPRHIPEVEDPDLDGPGPRLSHSPYRYVCFANWHGVKGNARGTLTIWGCLILRQAHMSMIYSWEMFFFWGGGTLCWTNDVEDILRGSQNAIDSTLSMPELMRSLARETRAPVVHCLEIKRINGPRLPMWDMCLVLSERMPCISCLKTH